MNFKEYKQRPELNYSSFKNIFRSPAYYKYMLTHQEETEAMRIGIACHSAILTPKEFETDYVASLNKENYKYKIVDDFKPLLEKYGIKKTTKKQVMIDAICEVCTEEEKAQIYDLQASIFEKANTGKEIIDFKEYEKCVAIKNSVMKSPKIVAMLKNGESEKSLFFEIEGVKMKGRLDFLSSNFFLDIKTCKDATIEGFSKDAYKLNYYCQMFCYQEAIFQNFGKRLPCIIFAIEKEDNLDYMVHEMPQEWLDLGEKKVRKYLRLYKECLEKDEWPGYDKKINQLVLPSWAKVEE